METRTTDIIGKILALTIIEAFILVFLYRIITLQLLILAMLIVAFAYLSFSISHKISHKIPSKYHWRLKNTLLILAILTVAYLCAGFFAPYFGIVGDDATFFSLGVALIAMYSCETVILWARLRKSQFVRINLKTAPRQQQSTPEQSWASIVEKDWYESSSFLFVILFVTVAYFLTLGNLMRALPFMLGLIFWFCIWLLMTRLSYEQNKTTETVYNEGFGAYIEDGNLKLPRQVYVGSSHNIYADLKAVAAEKSDEDFTVELQAAGLLVNGDLAQRKKIEPHTRTCYLWNCCFPMSGVHSINLLFKRVLADSKESEMLVRTHTFKVVEFYRELWKPALSLLIPLIPILFQVSTYLLHR